MYKKKRSEAFKIRQNPFSAGALPQTPLGELMTLPQTPYSRLGMGHPSSYSTLLGTDLPSTLPSEFQPDLYAYAGLNRCSCGVTISRRCTLVLPAWLV